MHEIALLNVEVNSVLLSIFFPPKSSIYSRENLLFINVWDGGGLKLVL